VGDDRFVPRGHPESNVTALDDVLLGGAGSTGGAPLPTANIHPFPTDRALAEFRDTRWCAAQYAEELCAQVPMVDGNWPGFDLIFVGVGDDGHVLSCFPESPALASMAWTMGIPAPSHIGPHLPRVTINPRLLEAAPVLVVTWGAGKARPWATSSARFETSAAGRSSGRAGRARSGSWTKRRPPRSPPTFAASDPAAESLSALRS